MKTNRRTLFPCVAALTVTFLCAAPAAEPKPVLAKGRTLVFADDHDILYRSGTRRVLHPPTKHPQNPLITEDKPWELAIGWVSVHRDAKTGKYQLWYQAYAGKRAQLKTHECTVAYAESDDGITFTKPNLGLFDFNGDRSNNIVLIGSGVYGDRYCNSVIVDAADPDPNRRYKMAFSDWSVDDKGEYWVGMHVAFSPDGIRWTKHPGPPLHRSFYGAKQVQPPLLGENPYGETKLPDGRVRRRALLPLTHSDAADVIYDPKRKAFVIYGKMWIDGPDGGMGWKHAMGRSESKDFLNWSKPQLVCWPDDEDGALEFHTSPVFIHRERYFSLNQILNRANQGMMDVELMVSRDGFEWERPFRAPFFIPRSPGEQFDSGTIVTTASFITHGNEMRFYYGAYSSGAIGGGTNITGDQQKSGVGLATLPLDRFAGLRSEPQPASAKVKSPPNIGQITLKPLDFYKCRQITVNADASKGAVRAELLTADGYRVPGFTKADSAALRGDNLRHVLKWKGGGINKLPRATYLVRLHLESAEAFAVTFE
ncbi:MAG: hypothetical protein HZA89_05795 [Verrucomicrobia bacterium]|nr:hypothetical protein [Verrucomicrobiota bacterium]